MTISIDLSGRTAIVTGSTAGIGRAIVIALADAGANVVLNGRSEAGVAAALAELPARFAPGQVIGIAADLGTLAGATALTEQVPAPDILVNNVAAFERKPFMALTDEEWFAYFETNLMSGVRLSRAWLPSMMSKGWGRIINISSTAAITCPADMAHYNVSKLGLIGLSRTLATVAAGTGVTVNSVLPGMTRSFGFSNMFNHEAEQSGKSVAELEAAFIERILPHSLIKRVAEPEEVASLVLYLASDLASVSNGSAYRADGGAITAI